MKDLKCISNNVEKFWTGRCYYREKKAVYLYRDNINQIVYLERKSETDVLISNEISMDIKIVSQCPEFSLYTRQQLFTFFKRGLAKYYNVEGLSKVVLFNKEIESFLTALRDISVSINFHNNQLTFNFYSESCYSEKTKSIILQLIDRIIKEAKLF